MKLGNSRKRLLSHRQLNDHLKLHASNMCTTDAITFNRFGKENQTHVINGSMNLLLVEQLLDNICKSFFIFIRFF